MATLAYHVFKQQVSYDGGVTWVDAQPYTTIKMPVTGATCEVPWSARMVATFSETKVTDPCRSEEGHEIRVRSGCTWVEYENPTDYYHNLCDGDIVTSADTTNVNTLFYKVSMAPSVPGGGSAGRFSFSKLILKDNIKTIDDNAFHGNYISDIVFSGTSQLETIGNYAFGFNHIGGANQITPQEYSVEEIGTFTVGSKRTFNIPNSLKNIGQAAFYFYCSVNYFFKDDFVFGANSLIENIGDRAFEKTNGVRIFFNMPTPPSNISSTIFNGRPGVIIVPNQYLSSYRTALSGLSQYICSTTALGSASKAEFGDGYDGGVITIPCDSTSSLTFDENSKIYGSYWLKIGDCVETISGGSNSDLLYLNLGNSLKHIGNNMFSGLNILDEITLPESLRTIGDSAFTACYRIKDVVIPSGVTSIGDYAFANCESLRNITVGGGSIGDGAFSFTFSNNATSYDSINILEGVTSIGASAFTNVGLNMFDLTIPDSVTSIGDYAFRTNYPNQCCAITGVTIGSGITNIGNDALTFVATLAGVRFTLRGTSNLETIGSSVFYGATGLGDLDLPNVELISAYSFSHCEDLTSIHIGDKIRRIGTYAFNECNNLTSITIDKENPDSVILDWGALNNTNNCPIYVPCDSFLAYKDSLNWSIYKTRIMPKPECPPITLKLYGVNRSGSTFSVACDGDSTLTFNDTRYTVPVMAEIGSCCTKIGDEAFIFESDLTSITISDTVTEIGRSAFTSCYNLPSINLPSGLTSIGDYAFRGCRGLTDITIPSSIMEIDNNAFDNCSGLTSITVNTTTPPYLGSSAFDGSTCPIYVPAESVNAYKSAYRWIDYASRIQPIT